MTSKRMTGPELCVLAIYMTALLINASTSKAVSSFIGVNYGRVANDLPDPKTVAQFLASQSVGKVKIYDADRDVIQAFADTQIQLVIGLPNEELYTMATNTSSAYSWVKQNVAAYYPSTQITGIAVGNEVLTSAPDLSGNLLQAMNNIHSALVNLKLDSAVKVSTPHSMSILSASYPPSAGEFNASYATSVIQPILNFLVVTNSYVMVNVYPFFAYSSNPTQVPLNYALFLPTQPVVDSNTGLQYTNLFDAQVDAFYSAMASLNKNFMNLTVTVTETGWPSLGDPTEVGASNQNAEDYNGNLVRNIISNVGTPLKPDVAIQTFLFALFNEDQKPGPTSERNYGIFYPNMEQVYKLNLTTGVYSGSGSQNKGANPTFCIAKSEATSSSLQAALDYACGPGGANCQPLQPGEACFEPNTVWAHASYAFNSYYQNNQRSSEACFFGGNSVVDTGTPSSGTCTYPTQ